MANVKHHTTGTTYYNATCPDGTVVTRSTKSMEYAWVAIAQGCGYKMPATYWGAVRWSGTMNGAGAEADRYAKMGYTVDLVPAVSVCRAEYLAAKKGTTEAPEAPQAPTSDLAEVIAAIQAAPKAKPVVRAPGAPAAKVAKRWLVSDATPTHVCRTCGVEMHASKFPTVAGPEVRGTQCRGCRDAHKVAK